MYHYYMFNKPFGCVCARRDDRYPTVMDYFSDHNDSPFLKNRNMFKMVSVFLQVLVYYKEEKECCWNNNKNKNNYNTAIKMSVMYLK